MTVPLAEILRPKSLHEVVGQNHLVGPEGFLTRIIGSKRPLSLLLWGPPGCGKTTIAYLYAQAFHAKCVSFSAVSTGVAEIKKLISDNQALPLFQKIILFVDEIHRFNKAQQDLFLPYLEKGELILIGATTENPSFSLNNALLSRLRVLTLNPLDHASLSILLNQYESKVGTLPLNEEAKKYLIDLSHGDGRYLFNLIENVVQSMVDTTLGVDDLQPYIQRRAPLFDKEGEQHYDLISALHKSVRGSDPQAALYWFCRIIEGGESPLFLARRIIRMASEDIGLADPNALTLAVSAKEAYEMLGSPEGELALAEVVIYLALAPKSNAIYTAYHQARELASQTNHLQPPKHILNAPTKLMKSFGYGKNYIYDHDTPNAFSGQNYFPEDLEREEFYQPNDRGFEREMKKRIEYFKKLRESKEDINPL